MEPGADETICKRTVCAREHCRFVVSEGTPCHPRLYP
jgi:hypothetical protein